MVDTLLWIIPGFMCSDLWLQRVDVGNNPVGRRSRLYLELRRFLAGDVFDWLKYPNPVSFPGYRIEVGEPLQALAYADLIAFANDTKPKGWALNVFTYDWRRPAREIGLDLANAIQGYGSRVGRHVLVGHSMGAPVAHAAWAHLVDAGKTSLVSRILTIAGVLWGSYASVRTWQGHEDSANLFAMLGALGNTAFGLRSRDVFPTQRVMYRKLLECFMSWPSSYDLLPDPAKGDDPNDTNRAWVWGPGKWEDALVPPNADLMLASINTWHDWIHQAKYTPPPSVMVHAIADHQETPYGLLPPVKADLNLTGIAGTPDVRLEMFARQQKLPRCGVILYGDNRVTQWQQSLPGHYAELFNAAHAEVQFHPALLARLFNLLTMQVPSPVPAPVAAPTTPADWPTRTSSRAPFLFQVAANL